MSDVAVCGMCFGRGYYLHPLNGYTYCCTETTEKASAKDD